MLSWDLLMFKDLRARTKFAILCGVSADDHRRDGCLHSPRD